MPVALGTDFNPGTSPAPNAQLAMSFAVHQLKLTPAEALAAMTINAAAALGMADTHGSLEEGKHADLVDLGCPTRTRCCPTGWARTSCDGRQARPRGLLGGLSRRSA